MVPENNSNLHFGEGSSSDHITSNNTEALLAQLALDTNYHLRNWSIVQNFPEPEQRMANEQQQMANLPGSESSSFNPVYNNTPFYDYNSVDANNVVAAYDQYNMSGASYQVPAYQVTYPVANEQMGVSNVPVDYNLYNTNQYAQNNMTYYQQNWNPNCAGYSGYTIHNAEPAVQRISEPANQRISEPANQRPIPELHRIVDMINPSTSNANTPQPLQKRIKLEGPFPGEQVVSSSTAAQEPGPSLDEQEEPGPSHDEQEKPRRKSRISTPPHHTTLDRVFIWDLDETLILLNSLMDGTYAARFQRNRQETTELGQKLESLILQVADKYFHYGELEAHQHVHINDPVTDHNGQNLPGIVNYNFSNLSKSHSPEVVNLVRISDRYRLIKQLYNNHRQSLQVLLNRYENMQLSSLIVCYEKLTQYWGTIAKSCLQDINARKNCMNVLVTSSQFVPAVVKVLLYDLGNFFPIENIYCATKISKRECFERISSRFSLGKCTFVVIGDGPDEEKAALEMNFPFWRVSSHEDLKGLFCALEKEYL